MSDIQSRLYDVLTSPELEGKDIFNLLVMEQCKRDGISDYIQGWEWADSLLAFIMIFFPPNGSIGEDNDGQVIIYTNRNSKGSVLG